MLCKDTCYAGYISVNTRPHQLHGDMHKFHCSTNIIDIDPNFLSKHFMCKLLIYNIFLKDQRLWCRLLLFIVALAIMFIAMVCSTS